MNQPGKNFEKRNGRQRAPCRAEGLERRRLFAVTADVHDKQIFFGDDLESSASGWTIDNAGPDAVAGTADDGLWHLSTRRGADVGHSSGHSFYYGSESSGTYNTGSRNAGRLTSPQVSLPTLGKNEKLNLYFNYYLETGVSLPPGPTSGGVGGPVQLDMANIAIVTASNGSISLGSNAPQAGLVDPSGRFIRCAIDVSAYAGQTVRFRFNFDTGNALNNAHEGWYIDDLRVSRSATSIWMADRFGIGEVDADTGTLLRSFSPPESTALFFGNDHAGLAWDGTSLYFVVGRSSGLAGATGSIYTLNPDNGAIVRQFDSPADTRIASLGVDPIAGVIYAADSDSDAIYRLDRLTGALLGTVHTGLPNEAIGMDFDGTTGHLFLSTDSGDSSTGLSRIHEIDPTNGSVIRSFDAPSTYATGIAAVDGRLFVGDDQTQFLYEVDRTDGRVLHSFKAPITGQPIGLGGADNSPPVINNDVPGRATSLGALARYDEANLSISSGDEDWFVGTFNANFTAALVLADANGNTTLDPDERLSLEIWRNPFADAAPVATGTVIGFNVTISSFAITSDAFTEFDTLFVRVNGASAAATNSYVLSLVTKDRLESNDTPATATNLGRLAGSFQERITSAGDDDWYRFTTVAANGTVALHAALTDRDQNNRIDPSERLTADLWTDSNHDGAPDTVARTATLQGIDLTIAGVPATANQTFWLRIAGATTGGITGSSIYELSIVNSDRFEPNDFDTGMRFTVSQAPPVPFGPFLIGHDAYAPTQVTDVPPRGDERHTNMQVAVNPANSNNLVIATETSYLDGDTLKLRTMVDAYYSTDAGATWKLVRLGTGDGFSSNPGIAERANPSVAFDRRGNVYISYTVRDASTAAGVVARSTNGGKTYTPTRAYTASASTRSLTRLDVAIGRDAAVPAQDDIYLAGALGPGDGGLAGRVVVFASKASNAGGTLPLSFSAALRVSDAAADGHPVTLPSVDVGPAGQVYVAWSDFSTNPTSIRFDVDRDGIGTGKTFGVDRVAATSQIAFPHYMPQQPERGIGPSPAIAVDRSGGKYNGRVHLTYVEYDDRYAGSGIGSSNVMAIWTDTASATAGSAWSAPQRLNSPNYPFGLIRYNWMPSIAVDQSTGGVSVSFLSEEGSFGSADVGGWTTRSADGGVSWGNLNETGASGSQDGHASNIKDFGDYLGTDAYGGRGFFALPHTEQVTFNHDSAWIEIPGLTEHAQLDDLTLTYYDADDFKFTAANGVPVLITLDLMDLNGNSVLDEAEKPQASLLYDYSGDGLSQSDQYSAGASFYYDSTLGPDGCFHLYLSSTGSYSSSGVVTYLLEVARNASGFIFENVLSANAYRLHIDCPILLHDETISTGFVPASVVTLTRSASDPRFLDVSIREPNGNPLNDFRYLLTELRSLKIELGGENDLVVLDFANGPFIPSAGSAGVPEITLTNLYGGATSLEIVNGAATEAFESGPQPGTSILTENFGAGVVQKIATVNLGTVASSGAGKVTVLGTPASDAIVYSAGASASRGRIEFGGLRYEFTNKSNVRISAGAGIDTVSVENPNRPAGLLRLDVDAGSVLPGQVLTVAGTAAALDIDRTAGTIAGAAGPLSTVLVGYAGFESITARAASSTTLAVRGASQYAVTPGSAPDAGSINAGGFPIRFTGFGSNRAIRFIGANASSLLIVDGTADNDTFSIAAAAGDVSIPGRATVRTSSIASLILRGGSGDDTFKLPLVNIPYVSVTSEGGAEGSGAGDSLNLTGSAGTDDIVIKGQTVTRAGKAFAFNGIEDLHIDLNTGVDAITYRGTAGVQDAVTLTASTPAGSGRLLVSDRLNASFANAEGISVLDGSVVDGDALTIVGTAAADRFDVNLAAAGTAASPILAIKNAAGSTAWLTLRSYSGFSGLILNSLSGADVFSVTTASIASLGRRLLWIDGGDDSDKLSVLYSGAGTTAINDKAGKRVTIDFGQIESLVSYANLESVFLQRTD